jgi:hypothetical protein
MRWDGQVKVSPAPHAHRGLPPVASHHHVAGCQSLDQWTGISHLPATQDPVDMGKMELIPGLRALQPY